MSFIICSSPFGSWSSRPQPCDSDHRYRDSGEIYYYNHHINWISSFVKIMTNIETRKSTWSQRIISDNCAVVASQGFTTSIITNKDVHRIGQSDWAVNPIEPSNSIRSFGLDWKKFYIGYRLRFSQFKGFGLHCRLSTFQSAKYVNLKPIIYNYIYLNI